MYWRIFTVVSSILPPTLKRDGMNAVLFRLIGSLIVFAVIEGSAVAATPASMTPIQISICPPVQLVPDNWAVCGLRLDLPYGNNRDLYGIDAGIGNTVSDEFVGIQVGGINSIIGLESHAIGLQVAGIVNDSVGNMKGIQIGFWNQGGGFEGAQMGFINLVRGDFAGVQMGIINTAIGFDKEIMRKIALSRGGSSRCSVTPGTSAGVQIGLFNDASPSPMQGVQLGLINNAANIKGVQIGLVNSADVMKGVQIGLINIVMESPVPFLPIINTHF